MWERMTIDEYADFETANRSRLVVVDGIWWRASRPFFYQPLFPFLEILPYSRKAPRASLLGGYQHLVAGFETANCRRNFFVWDDVHNYSIESVNHDRRKSIKNGMKHFSVREVDDMKEFISAGHPVYLSFYERTKYNYKEERVDKKCFTRWAETLYRFPKVKILGAYHKGELSAIDISYLVENVLIDATFFCKTEHLKYRVADYMGHILREKTAICPNIGFIYKGTVTGHRGLDESKLIRGCKILSKPAFYHLNPLADFVLRRCMRKSYEKLIGSLDNVSYREGPGIKGMFP